MSVRTKKAALAAVYVLLIAAAIVLAATSPYTPRAIRRDLDALDARVRALEAR